MKLSAAQTFMASLPGVWSKPHGGGTSYLVGKRRFVSLFGDGKQLIVGVPLETAKEAVRRTQQRSRSTGGVGCTTGYASRSRTQLRTPCAT